MKKIMVTLLAVAVAMNLMAETITAKAKLTLSDGVNSCDLFLVEAEEYGALTGSPMNMEGRKIALYALNGAEKLQITEAKSLNNVKLGLLTDVATNYTITVSQVGGSEKLYLHDNVTGLNHELTAGTIDITATASSTDETRFWLRKNIEDPMGVCFINNKLTISDNPYPEDIVIETIDGTPIAGSPFAASTTLVDFTSIGAAGDRFVVKFHNGDKKLIFIKE